MPKNSVRKINKTIASQFSSVKEPIALHPFRSKKDTIAIFNNMIQVLGEPLSSFRLMRLTSAGPS